jgi:hypothetical protein
MEYIIIDTNEHNGKRKGVNIFFSVQILSGKHQGKYATTLNAITDFPELFEELEYEEVELELFDFQKDYTIPEPNPYYLEVLPEFLGVFKNNKFIFGQYEIPLYEINNIKCVNTAHFGWQQFKDDLDELLPDGTFKHKALKDVLMDLWDDLALKFENQDFITV